MEIKRKHVFNLWDTNGRRHDVINAIDIYLQILRDLNEHYPDEAWDVYPKSIKQYMFYKKAIEASPEIFQDHGRFDIFEQSISDKLDLFLTKTLSLDNKKCSELDLNIEKRARHYTNNLVKLGLVDKQRNITTNGKAFLSGHVKRDKLEELLPITDTNLILFRQLLNLKIYSEPNSEGERSYYSPCLMAFYMLLNEDRIDVNKFKQQIQGASPYWKDKIQFNGLHGIDLPNLIIEETEIPILFKETAKITKKDFSCYIRNRKSNDVISIYYSFYSALYDYVANPNDDNYHTLRDILLGEGGSKIEKAFGTGTEMLKCGTKSSPFNKEQFNEKNNHNPLLSKTLNEELYKCYSVSKYIDTAREYSDTTVRMLGATGLFQFSKPLVELSHKRLFEIIFSCYDFEHTIFGDVSEDEYESLQASYYNGEITFADIINYDNIKVDETIEKLRNTYGESVDIRSILVDENKEKLEEHIKEKYTKEAIIKLLKMFSDRKNDKKIKKYVNEEATVPTIYEYLIAIAWYYISGERISVYDSLNLTLNGDLEPVIHAAGGAGDIVVRYDDKIVMLEATLMNAAAQKRGEWEPVLRHAINLTAESYPKKVLTLFVADELDYNTINIWRAVAAVTLRSSITNEKTEHVVIMPFTNNHFCYFIENEINDNSIVSAIDKSYDEIKNNFDDTWHGKIIEQINDRKK